VDPPPAAVGDLRTVAVWGGPAPAELGGIYRRLRSASINDAGEVVFAAELGGSPAASAIVRVTGDRDTVLVRAGDPAPGGGRYEWFGEVDIGDDGSVLFQAELTGSQASEGVFLQTATGTKAVARSGDRSPAGLEYTAFRGLTLTSYPLDGAPYFRLAYIAHTAGDRRTFVIWPSYRAPCTVLTTGDPVAGGELENFWISRLGFAVCVVAQVRRDAGLRRVALLANEDQLTWGSRLRDGGRFPELGRIGRLLEPTGMYVHHGVVTAELDDGRTVMATHPAGGDPEVFARAGDVAPGMPDQHITRFGPPVANHGLPEAGPCGVASVATLEGGAKALWLGVFTSQLPMAGAAVIPLVDGDETDDVPPASVSDFHPVKLTNTGSLLLWSALHTDGQPGEGLLVIDRLFDWYQPH
jgi:hypothetical protein